MTLESPFAHRLGTNDVAHPEEEATIRAIISSQAAPINALEQEIDEIEKTIAVLEVRREERASRRHEYLAFVDGHRQLLSSVLRLSEDVLSIIFSHLSPTSGEWTIGGDDPHPIVQLSHVCRQWRAVTVSTPSLWALLSVTDLPSLDELNDAALEAFEMKMRRVIDVVSTCVTRAARFPITLVFSADDRNFLFNFPTSDIFVRRLVEILRQARWADIDITLGVSVVSSPLVKLLDTPQHSADTIRRARIRLSCDSIVTSHVVMGGLNLTDARQLTSLEVSMSGGDIHAARLHWAALTELKLADCMSIASAAVVLTFCPNLVQCTFELTRETPPPFNLPPIPQATLRYLQTLRLSGYYTTERLPRSLHLPSLRTLSILDTAFPHVVPFDTVLLEWIRVYGAQLREMMFTYSRLTLPALLSTLQGLPNLVALDLLPAHPSIQETVSNFGRSILPAMTPMVLEGRGQTTTTPLCPKLESFVVYLPSLHVRTEEWVSFITSRRRQGVNHGAFLKKIQVHLQAVDRYYAMSAQTPKLEITKALSERGVDMDGIAVYVHRVKYV